jgi:hypothetical protein
MVGGQLGGARTNRRPYLLEWVCTDYAFDDRGPVAPPGKGWPPGTAPIPHFPGIGANHRGPFRRFHVPTSRDLHSKRVATDADYWISWLERLVAREEALLRSETPVSAT